MADHTTLMLHPQTNRIRMMDHALRTDEAAIVAAALATEATAELLRYAREGEYSPRNAFGDEVFGKLAEALKLAIEIEGEPPADTHLDDDEIALLAALSTALGAFLEGWVG